MGDKLAIDGGTPVRTGPMPSRSLLGQEEKAAAMALFDEAIASGNAFGYNGPAEQEYECTFVEFMNGGFADGVNSGTNAVFCALGALQLDALSEVIVPPITDPGGVMPVLFLGCVPMVADCAPGTYNTSAEQIEPLITERTKAIVVAHIGGDPVDMDPVMELAKKHGLYVVEDCAQSHGATYKGRLVGTMGHIAAFSTMFGKHHCTGGQGGIVYTKDEELHWEGKRFADRGKPMNLDAAGNVRAGLNCNLNDMSATIGTQQLKKLPSIIRRRRAVGDTLKERLGTDGPVSIGWQVPQTEPVYWFLRVKLELGALSADKETFCEALKAEGIPNAPSYRHIPAEAPWFESKSVFGNSGFPWHASDYKGDRNPSFKLDNAVKVTDEHFNIVMHESYGEAEIDAIHQALTKVADAYAK